MFQWNTGTLGIPGFDSKSWNTLTVPFSWEEFGKLTRQAFRPPLEDRHFEILWGVSERPEESRYDLLASLGMVRNELYPAVDWLQKNWYLVSSPIDNRPGPGPVLKYRLTSKGRLAAVGILAKRREWVR